MEMIANLSDQVGRALGAMGPLAWWLTLLVVAGLVGGIATGYFRARKIQPGGFKWSVFRREVSGPART